MRIVFLCVSLLFTLTVSAGARNGVPIYTPADRIAAAEPAHPGTRDLNRYQSERLSAFLNRISAPLDTLRLAVIQAQFADSLFGGPGSHRPDLRDSLYFSNELKHLRDYFRGASQGRFQIVWDILGPVITLPKGMGYYGEDEFEEQRVVEMVQELITISDASVDFSHYHALFVIHAGAGQETDTDDNSRGQMWSSFYDLDDIQSAFPDSAVTGLATNDLVGGEPFFVDNFIIAPANPSQDGTTIGSLGIWAYMTGSRLGLLPLSDTTPGGFPDSRGAGNFCLMSYGLYAALAIIPTFPCTFNRILAGWIEPYEVTGDGTFQLRDINSTVAVDTACLKIPITESEYFLVVNRVHDTNFDQIFSFVNLDTACLTPDNGDSLGGAEFDFFLTDLTNPFTVGVDPACPDVEKRFVDTGSGIYVWHIDERIIQENLAAGYLPNDFVHFKGVDLEEADGIQDLDQSGGAITLGGYFDSYRSGHNAHFGPATKPPSTANSGAATGITVEIGGPAAPVMPCTVTFAPAFDQTISTWEAAGTSQPPVPVDLNGDARLEIMLLADSSGVFMLNGDNREFYDWDGDPATIEPYIAAAEAAWAGPAAYGPIDDQLGGEIVAAGSDGALYAWHGDGNEVYDGDGIPGTVGILQTGEPIAAPPLLADVDNDGDNEIAVIRLRSDSLIAGFVDETGTDLRPVHPDFEQLWPVRLQAQLCAPPAFGYCGNDLTNSRGVVISWVDTLGARSGATYVPVSRGPIVFSRGNESRAIQPAARQLRPDIWSIEFDRGSATAMQTVTLLPPAVGDLDLDGFDEMVLVLPEGKLIIHDNSPRAGQTETVSINLHGRNPSPPSLGDVDGNGTLEIVLWDSAYYYIFSGNGSPLTNWPKPRHAQAGIERPPVPETLFPAPALITDIDGDSQAELLFVGYDGSAFAFTSRGEAAADFPRPVPAGVLATPAVADLEDTGDITFILAGYTAALAFRDAVFDSLHTTDVLALALQELPGPAGVAYWDSERNGGLRWGRAEPVVDQPVKSKLIEAHSCILYPSPVAGGSVSVRVIINQAASIEVTIYNLEGEDALSFNYDSVNPGGLAEYIFDERVDVSALKSGLYFARLHIRGPGASEVIVKPFAIKR